jgi:hypothetical protein
MEIPVRVQELAELLAGKGLTPVGYAEQEEHYLVQISEGG